MKHYLYIASIATAACLSLASCGEASKPSTTPVHTAEPSIVATTEDEMRNVVADMLAVTDASASMTQGLRQVTDEAAHLVIGNPDGVRYVPFDWYGRQLSDDSQEHSNTVGKVHVSKDSVNIEMNYSDATHNFPYVMVMKHEQGKWLIDDIIFPGAEAPKDTERHAAGAYADAAINNLTSGDAPYTVQARIVPLAEACRNNPAATPQAVKDIETAHNFIKQARGYDEKLEETIQATLKALSKHQ